MSREPCDAAGKAKRVADLEKRPALYLPEISRKDLEAAYSTVIRILDAREKQFNEDRKKIAELEEKWQAAVSLGNTRNHRIAELKKEVERLRRYACDAAPCCDDCTDEVTR